MIPAPLPAPTGDDYGDALADAERYARDYVRRMTRWGYCSRCSAMPHAEGCDVKWWAAWLERIDGKAA